MLSEEGDMTIWHPAASSGHLRSDKLKTNTCDVFCCRQKTRPNSHAHASVRTSTANQTVNLLNSPERRALQPATEITQQLRNLTSAQETSCEAHSVTSATGQHRSVACKNKYIPSFNKAQAARYWC